MCSPDGIYPGIYLVLTILSIGLMLRRRSGRRKNLSFVYSIFMLLITLGWFCANTMNNEVGVIENMIKPIDLSKTDYYCSTLNTTAEALMSAVFVGSDILLVSQLFPVCQRGLTFGRSIVCTSSTSVGGS
jgi:hypothetical protein